LEKCEDRTDGICENEAVWDIGFSKILRNDGWGFEAGDTMTFQVKMCSIHFLSMDGCGNVICFRKIGEEKWRDWFDEFSYDLVPRCPRKECKHTDLVVPSNCEYWRCGYCSYHSIQNKRILEHGVE
jgi:hypothetical protein